jgi:hypothetical protein
MTAGTYTVSVIAAESGSGVNPVCTTDVSTTFVMYDPTVIGSESIGSTDPTCYGNSNGTITVVDASGGIHDAVVGGTRSYRYSLTKSGTPGTYAGPQTSNSFSGLAIGTYNVLVTALATTNGSMTNPECVTTIGQVVLTEPEILAATLTDDANTTAPFIKSGDAVTFTLTITGGTKAAGDNPYTVTWTATADPDEAATPVLVTSSSSGTYTYEIDASNANTLGADRISGTYTVTVTDANNCPTSGGPLTASTYVNVYDRSNLFVNANSVLDGTCNPYPGSDVTGTGTSSRPLSTITQAMAVAASSGETISIMQGLSTPTCATITKIGSGEPEYGPEVTKNVTFKRVSHLTPSTQISVEPEWADSVAPALRKGFVIATSSCTFDGFTPSLLYVKDGDADDNVCAGDMQFAINSVTSGGSVRLLPGTWLVSSPLTINKAITLGGLEPTNLASTSCDLNPTTWLKAAGTTKMMIFQGPLEKTVRNLIMQVGQSVSGGTTTTGRYMEVQSGSSGNVNVSNMIFKHHRAGGASDTVRLFGLTNGQFSGGALNDVAKFVNDADDNAGFGTGRVLFNIQGPLPWQILDIGWKAEDCGTMNDATLVTNMNSMTTRNTNQLRATTATRPAVRTGASGINSRAALEFVGNTRVMSATPNAAIMTGTQKSVMVVFRTPGTNLASADRQVLYKQGDDLTGISIVLTGTTGGTTTDLLMSVYSSSDGTSASTVSTFHRFTSVVGSTAGTVYMAQVYFNGDGSNNNARRVGFGLQAKGSSSGTYEYKTAADFPVTSFYKHPSYSTTQSISLGARVGGVRYGTETTTGTGVTMHLGKGLGANAALVSEVLVFGTASLNVREAAYCYLRNKYLENNDYANQLLKDTPNEEVVAGDVGFVEEIDVYPNPAEEDVVVTVSARQAGPLKVELVDALGRVVQSLYNGYATENFVLPLDLNVRRYTSGTYVIRAVGAGDLNLSQPFIIRK